MIKIDLSIKGLDKMQRQLEQLSKKGLAAASREALTNLAWAARPIWQGKLGEANTLRNSWTAKGVRVVPARGTNIKEMEATLGHPDKYVADLERGHDQTAKGKAVGIPELAARTGGDRKKLVGRANKLGTIGKLFTGTSTGKTWKARNAFRLRKAKKAGKKLLVLENSRGRAIYRVKSRKVVTKVWDLNQRSVKRPKRPTLQRTLDAVLHQGPEIAHKAMTKQLALLK